ncbi:MAG: DEAD/DEAH box helicase [bacterium]
MKVNPAVQQPQDVQRVTIEEFSKTVPDETPLVASNDSRNSPDHVKQIHGVVNVETADGVNQDPKSTNALEFITKLLEFDKRSNFLNILNNIKGPGVTAKIGKLINLCKQHGQNLSSLNDEEKKIIEAIKKNFGENFISIISLLPSRDGILAKFNIQDLLTDQTISSYANFFDLTRHSLDLFITQLSSFEQRSNFLNILNNIKGEGVRAKIVKLINLCKQHGQNLSSLNDEEEEERKIIEAVKNNFGEDFIGIVSLLPSSDNTLAKFNIQDSLTDQTISSYSNFFDLTKLSSDLFVNKLSGFEQRSNFLDILNNIKGHSVVGKIVKLIKLCQQHGQNLSSLNDEEEERKIIEAVKNNFGEDFIGIISLLPSSVPALAQLNLQDPLTGQLISSYANFFDLTRHSVNLFITQLSSEVNSDPKLINAQQFFHQLSDFKKRYDFLNILNKIKGEGVRAKIVKLINLCKQHGQNLSSLNDEEKKIIEAIKKNFGENFISIISLLPSSAPVLAKFNIQDLLTDQTISSYSIFFDLTRHSVNLFITQLSSFEQRSDFLNILNNIESNNGVAEKVPKLIKLCQQHGQNLSSLNDDEEEERKIIEAVKKNFGEDFIGIISLLPSSVPALAQLNLQDPLTGQLISSYPNFLRAKKTNVAENKKTSEIQAAEAVKGFILNLDDKLFKLPVQDLIAVLEILKADENNPLNSMSENELQNLTKILREGIIVSLEPSDLDERLRRETKVPTEPEVIQELNNENIDTGRDAIPAVPISIKEILARIEALDTVISQSPDLEWSKLRDLLKANAVNNLWTQYKGISNDKDARSKFSQQIQKTSNDASADTLVKEISTKFIEEKQEVLTLIKKSLDKNTRKDWKTNYGLILPDEIPQLNLNQALTIVRSQEQKDLLLPAGTGSGKTLAAIATSRFNKSKFTLVLSPAAIKEQWVNNLKKFTDENSVHILNNDLEELRTLDHLIEKAKKYQDKILYLVLPYSKLSQDYSPELVKKISSLPIDFVVADESHYLKNPESKTAINTRELISNLRNQHNETNKTPFRTLSMTATPVLASIDDAKNTWKTVTGSGVNVVQESLNTKISRIREEIIPSTLPGNQTHNKFPITFRLGFGANREENLTATFNIDEEPNKDATRQDILNRILNSKYPSQIEAALVRAKAQVIGNHCNADKKTIIYTNYLDDQNQQNYNIIDELKGTLKDKFKEDQIAILTGKSKEGLEEFKNNPNKKVLIMSPTSMYGIDGLQNVCSRMIIASLPWTTALDQVIGRLARKGQSEPVEVIIPSARIQLDDGTYLPDYDLMKMNIIEKRQRIANAFLNGASLEGILPSEKSLMNFIQRRIEALKPADLIDKALKDIDTAKPLPEPIQLRSEESIPDSDGTSSKYPNFFKYHRVLKWENSQKTHELFAMQGEEGIKFWHAYHDDLDKLHGDKVRPMDKLIWEIMRRPSYYLKNSSENSQESATIVNMGCGRDLLQERSLKAPTKEAGTSLQDWLKERCQINELNIYDIDHVSVKKDLKLGDSNHQVSSISDNAAELSSETLKKINSSGGADLVTFSLSVRGKDWEYAIIQASEILKSKGKILIVDQDQVWNNDRKQKLKNIAKDLGMNLQEKHQGTLVIFTLAK